MVYFVNLAKCSLSGIDVLGFYDVRNFIFVVRWIEFWGEACILKDSRFRL